MKRVKREPTVFNKFVQAELARMKEQVRPSRSERLEKFEFENDRPDQHRDAPRPTTPTRPFCGREESESRLPVRIQKQDVAD